jgi:RNA polymerase sigma-70 factor (ECF subfamily)
MSALLGNAPVARPTEPAELTRYLYEKYGQRVFTFCYSRLRNREEAQDAAQTTFIYVLRSLQRGVEPEFELAWLLKIAFNVCRGTRRSTSRLTAVTQDVEDVDTLAAPPAPGYEGSERVAALRDALAHLPESQRRGILLREWQGLSYAEIADELGLTHGAVETLLFRARRNLASRLQHVRSGVGAFNVVTLAPLLRSLFRGGLGKLGLIGATATVALLPVAIAEVRPALANGEPAPTLRTPVVSTQVGHQLSRSTRSGVTAAVTASRPRARTGVLTAKPGPLPQAATSTVEAGSGLSPVTPEPSSSLPAPFAAAPGPVVIDPPGVPDTEVSVPKLPATTEAATGEVLYLVTNTLNGLQTSLP